mgnify:CR=1 FL=1
MKRLFALLLLPVTLLSFGSTAGHQQHSQTLSDDLLTPPQMFAMQKLRQYCTACHGLGKLRFIYSDDNVSLWKDIHTLRSPKSQNLWVDEILKVLDWPSNSAPPFDQMIQSPDKDWMPKGKKRLDLASDQDEGYYARQAILDVLRNLAN